MTLYCAEIKASDYAQCTTVHNRTVETCKTWDLLPNLHYLYTNCNLKTRSSFGTSHVYVHGDFTVHGGSRV